MQRRLHSLCLPTNEGFAGIYDFEDVDGFARYLPGFIASLENPNGILVVHPGRKEEWRRCEFETLQSTELKLTSNRFRPVQNR